MCFSFKTSIISYSIGIISSIFAFSTKQYVLGTLILFFCQIQLSEAIIWKGIDNNDIELNKRGTLFGKYALPSHNIGIGIGILLSVILVSKSIPKFKDYIPLILGIMFYIFVIIVKYKGKYRDTTFPREMCPDKSCQNNNNRLRWPFPYSWYIWSFILSLILMAIYVKPLGSKIFISGMFILSLIITYLLFPKSVGTMWCFTCAIISIILVFGNWIIIRNKKDIVV